MGFDGRLLYTSSEIAAYSHGAAQQYVQADLVVCAAQEPPSRRGAFSRFVGWFSHQAANASRWAAEQ